MEDYKLTLLGLLLATVVAVASIALQLELFETLVASLQTLEHLEADELLIPLVIFAVFSLLDSLRRYRHATVEAEKIKIYRAMVSSTHHVLNNFLNQMLLFKMTADKTPGFDPVVLQLYDQIIADTSAQIEAMSAVSDINETAIWASVSPSSGADKGGS